MQITGSSIEKGEKRGRPGHGRPDAAAAWQPGQLRRPSGPASPHLPPSERLRRFRDRCLNSHACMQMLVDRAPELIRTRGIIPVQAGPQSEQRPPVPTPPTGQGAIAGEAAPKRWPERVTLSNQYCNVAKLPGKWKGQYAQNGVLVPFDLTLKDAAGALTGESTEPDMRAGQSGAVSARWAGVLSAQGMVFERYYLVAPTVVSHYYGYCNKENTVISGEWRLGQKLSGEFELLREKD